MKKFDSQDKWEIVFLAWLIIYALGIFYFALDNGLNIGVKSLLIGGVIFPYLYWTRTSKSFDFEVKKKDVVVGMGEKA